MKYLFYITIINVLGVFASILYGFFGGSDGETTEFFFLGIAMTGLFSFLCLLFLLYFELKKTLPKWYWFLLFILMLTICIFEMKIINWRILLTNF